MCPSLQLIKKTFSFSTQMSHFAGHNKTSEQTKTDGPEDRQVRSHTHIQS